MLYAYILGQAMAEEGKEKNRQTNLPIYIVTELEVNRFHAHI